MMMKLQNFLECKMKILVDTHILVWLHTVDKRLSKKAISILSDINNTIYYSTVSIWESEIKHNLHPKDFAFSGIELERLSNLADLRNLPIESKHVFNINKLKYSKQAKKDHKDPFDKMLISQAKTEGMFLLTHDELISNYLEECIIFV